MRQISAVLVALLSALGLSACLAGPSEGDISAVHSAVEDLGREYSVWEVKGVLSGFTEYLSVAVKFDGSDYTADDLRELMTAVGTALPNDFAHSIHFSVYDVNAEGGSGAFVELQPLADELGLEDAIPLLSSVSVEWSDLAPLWESP